MSALFSMAVVVVMGIELRADHHIGADNRANAAQLITGYRDGSLPENICGP
jgi:hypothetical protein